MLCLHLVSFAAVIRVVTRHATLLPTKGSGEERCVTSDDPNNGCEWDYVYTMPDSVSFMPTRKAIRYSYFHSNFHHLNWFADTVRPFFGPDRAFSWRYSKSYTYDQLMAGTFACKTI